MTVRSCHHQPRPENFGRKRMCTIARQSPIARLHLLRLLIEATSYLLKAWFRAGIQAGEWPQIVLVSGIDQSVNPLCVFAKMAFLVADNQQPPKHPLPTKGLLQSEALLQYILDTSVFPREPEILKEMREIGENHPRGLMTLSADEAQFLMMLLKLMNAKNTIEVGVFTGYSLLCTALALPHDGKVIAMDIDREYYDLGRPVIEKAGVSHKVDFRQGPALEILDDILNKKEVEEGSIDFAFVDADKNNYMKYHERLLKLVKVGGVIAYDNTLWFGSVAGDASHPARSNPVFEKLRTEVLKLNQDLVKDERVEICQVSIGDGLTLCRRLV